MIAFAKDYDNIPLHTDEESTNIEWHKPVFADDVLTGRGAITRKEQRNPRNGLVEITIEAYNQDGVLVLTDVTEAIVKCKPQRSE